MVSSNEPEIEDPVTYFLEEQDYIGNSDTTKKNYRRVLCDFQEFLQDPARNPKGEVVDVAAADRRDCMAWVQELRDDTYDYSDSTIASYAARLHSFYNYMSDIGVFPANPMVLVLRKIPESVEKNPVRRDLTLTQMSEFVTQVHNPLTKAMVMTWLKTAMRLGELINLDIRDVHIDDEEIMREYPEVRAEIQDRPDTIFVTSDIAIGDVVNGEKRKFANKRKRDTVIPIDQELKVCLSQWLAVRPDTPNSAADPLFTAILHGWGQRIYGSTVEENIRTEARSYGWYSSDEDLRTNVTPHYFRHFFTTYMRRLSGDDGMVKYIRGDVGGEILDTYTHNWGDKVEETYHRHIYSLL